MTTKTSAGSRTPRAARPPAPSAAAPVPSAAQPSQAAAQQPSPGDALSIATLMMSAKDICKQLRVSKSHWHQLVAEGKAPRPAIQLPRFTRWRSTDVLAWVAAQQARG
jgi:predicted DNA-binding transcriptional regulator AlpA